MEGVTGVKYPASSYTIWLMSSVWRRKASILVVVVFTVLLIVCLQYNVSKEIVEITLSQQEGKGDEAAKDAVVEKMSGTHRVQFVAEDGRTSRENLVDVVGHSEKDDFVKMVDRDMLHTKILEPSSFKHNTQSPYVPRQRIIHLDFKGAPPKLSYLRKLFPMIKSIGATGILLEWEDMFPWENNLKVLAAKNAFTRTDARELVAAAQKQGLDVIPAVPTFGHLEFVLKNVDFVHLREVFESPQALCPSLNASIDLVQDMIDQVMQIHKDANFLHIGCDEVFHLGECSRCQKKLKDELFLSHIVHVANYIRKHYPYVVPIIWDDMLRHIPASTLELFNIGKLVEPMVWVYAEDVYHFVPQTVWEKYQSIFSWAWTASAFKGAFGETFYVPNVKRHLDNNMNWLTLMSGEESRFQKGFRGIAITGWQRYDHFATLCEMLPASIPSLVVNLVVVSHGYANNSLRDMLYKALNCGVSSSIGRYANDMDLRGGFLNLDSDPFLWEQFSKCMFSGSQFYRTLYRWHALEKEVNMYLTMAKTKKGWLTDYNIRRNYSIPFRVNELMADESRIYHNILLIVQSINDALLEVFDKYTISEWIEQKLYPTVLLLEQLQKAAHRLKSMHTWPRRPLQPLTDLQRIGVTVLSNTSKSMDMV